MIVRIRLEQIPPPPQYSFYLITQDYNPMQRAMKDWENHRDLLVM